MKILTSLLFLTITANVVAAPILGKINVYRFSILAGYPDGSIVIAPKDLSTVENPANCDDPLGYVIESDHDVQSALSVLVAAKSSAYSDNYEKYRDNHIFFSVRDDKCHTIQQIDGGQKLPVVQRVRF